MKTPIAAALGTLILIGCTYQVSAADEATPGQTEKSYNLSEFTGIDVATGIKVDFTTGEAQSVVIENENGAWDKINVEVRDDTLYLQRRKKAGFGYQRYKEKYSVTISAQQLSRLETSSGSTVTGTGLSGNEVSIDTSSGSSVKVAEISAGSLTVDTSSGSTATLAGSCSSISADTSSGSSVRAKDLTCASANLEASSGSSVSITATESISADASSGSSINVAGNPSDRDIDKSSGASVRIKS